MNLFKIFALALLLLVALPRGAFAQTPIPPPSCMVDQFYGNFHTGVSAAGDQVAIIWCDSQDGLRYWTIAGNYAKGVAGMACLPGPPIWSLAWMQSAWIACVTPGITADQKAAAYALAKTWAPRLFVTGPANQNVYTANADGTRGPQFVSGGFGMQVAPGTGCNGGRLLNAGARFADVSGQISTNGVTLPSGSFALCSITYPPAGGFTN